MKNKFIPLLPLMLISSCSNPQKQILPKNEKVVAAYTYHTGDVLPNPQYFNRIHYSYAWPDSSLTGLIIPNPERVGQLVSLKNEHPELLVTLSLGGKAGELSQIMRDDSLRTLFVADCVAGINRLGFDGIDLDWEAPGRGEGCLPVEQDTENYVKMIRELRETLDKDKIITMATSPTGWGVDFEKMTPLIDNYNIMTYDMGIPPYHHSALYRSDKVDWRCIADAVETYTSAGVPRDKIIIGVPFYGRGNGKGKDSISTTVYPEFTDYRLIRNNESTEFRWDSIACVPYITDNAGNMILTYDNQQSLAIKCRYITDNNLGGVMCWKYEADNDAGDLRNVLARHILPHRFAGKEKDTQY